MFEMLNRFSIDCIFSLRRMNFVHIIVRSSSMYICVRAHKSYCMIMCWVTCDWLAPIFTKLESSKVKHLGAWINTMVKHTTMKQFYMMKYINIVFITRFFFWFLIIFPLTESSSCIVLWGSLSFLLPFITICSCVCLSKKWRLITHTDDLNRLSDAAMPDKWTNLRMTNH